MPPSKKTDAVENAVELLPGVAMLMPDGGEAILVSVDGGEALLRCGTVHHDPIRRPLGQVSPVSEADETPRHAKFRAEAVLRGEIAEIERSEPASAE